MSQRMPVYSVTHEGSLVGYYRAQRPSVAATKAFGVLKRTKGLTYGRVHVSTQGCARQQTFNVHYDDTVQNTYGPPGAFVAVKELNDGTSKEIVQITNE